MNDLLRRLVSEAIGTAFLLAAVVGSGIMALKLSEGNGALALLCNTIPTGAILAVLILTFGPVSGGHFNPAVTLAFACRGEWSWRTAGLYIGAQTLGGIVGVWAAHLMFELPLWQFSATSRTGHGQWLAEAVATLGLGLTIFGCLARSPAAIPYAVGLYITAAYWFTPSTSFANPAVTVARSLSNTFAGIAPADVLAFVAAQLVGMSIAVALSEWLWPRAIRPGHTPIQIPEKAAEIGWPGRQGHKTGRSIFCDTDATASLAVRLAPPRGKSRRSRGGAFRGPRPQPWFRWTQA